MSKQASNDGSFGVPRESISMLEIGIICVPLGVKPPFQFSIVFGRSRWHLCCEVLLVQPAVGGVVEKISHYLLLFVEER